jgi:hypothetical protein
MPGALPSDLIEVCVLSLVASEERPTLRPNPLRRESAEMLEPRRFRMPRAVFVVLTNPASPDQEDEYNEFYDNTHVAEVCQTPGFVSARRFRISDAREPVGAVGDYGYLAIYEIETDDLAATFEALKAASPTMTPFPLVGRNGSYGVFVERVHKTADRSGRDHGA